MKHFNMGNVWGRVAGVKLEKSEGKGTPYLAIQIECPNQLYGNVKTYGRLWGQEKIDAFMDYHKKHPGSAYQFKGFFSQYDKEEGLRYSNYTFFSWLPFEGKEYRAAFVLTGEVTAKENLNGEGKLYLHLIREGQEGYKDIEENFEVYTLNIQELDGIQTDDTVQIKGLIRYKDAEDYFGSASSGPIRPYCMEIKVLQPDALKEAF